MECSGGVTDMVVRIIKMMDRTSLCLLNAIDDFEGWHTRIEANPKLSRPGTALCVVPPPEFASVAIIH
jgi:hypothetical protein